MALLVIDHVLIDRRCAVLTTSAHLLPGSDHRARYAELRLPAPHDRGDQAPPATMGRPLTNQELPVARNLPLRWMVSRCT